jgi:hypothetical protein
LIATVFFVPMQRYTLPITLPFNLEPYRPLVALVMMGWLLSLLTMEARLTRTPLDGPLLLFAAAICLSLVANPGRLSTYQSEALKAVTMLASFVLTYYLLTSVLRRREEIELVVRLFVSFGAVVAVCAVVEARTGFSPFTHLSTVLPILRELPADLSTIREGRVRAFGSAEHPIALGALLVMVTPFAVYLGVTTGRRIWWACCIALVVGALTTVSRTPVVMLAVVLATVCIARWADVRRHWFLIFPVVAIIHFAAPGTLGAIKGAFMPEGGLISEQSQLQNSAESGGRVTDLAPSLREFEKRPLFGDGMGTRITLGENANGRILDNQWLGLLLDTGLVGVLAFVWLVARFARQLLGMALTMPGPAGYLPLACAASVLAYVFGMFTYDSLAFAQVTFVFFMVLAIGAALQRVENTAPERPRLPRVSSARLEGRALHSVS